MIWTTIGLKFAPYIIAAIRSTERTSSAKGNEKKAEAMATVDELLASIEGACNAGISKIPDVREAAEKVIDAYVTLQNVIAKLKD